LYDNKLLSSLLQIQRWASDLRCSTETVSNKSSVAF